MFKKILKTLFGLSIGAGFLILLGTAGASDFSGIGLATILVQGVIGTALIWIGFIGLKVTNPVEND